MGIVIGILAGLGVGFFVGQHLQMKWRDKPKKKGHK